MSGNVDYFDTLRATLESFDLEISDYTVRFSSAKEAPIDVELFTEDLSDYKKEGVKRLISDYSYKVSVINDGRSTKDCVVYIKPPYGNGGMSANVTIRGAYKCAL